MKKNIKHGTGWLDNSTLQRVPRRNCAQGRSLPRSSVNSRHRRAEMKYLGEVKYYHDHDLILNDIICITYSYILYISYI